MSAGSSIPIRRLSGADAAEFQEIRLEGLERHPEAFSASFHEERGHPTAWFAERLSNGFVLGAERRQGRLLGVAGLLVPGSAKVRHRGSLWGMYVRAEACGNGTARRLVDGILMHARQHVEEVSLSVAAGNAVAIALYRSAGFAVVAQDPRALKIGDAYVDHLIMHVRFAS